MNNQTSKKSVRGRNGGTLNPGYYGQKNGRKKKMDSLIQEYFLSKENLKLTKGQIDDLIQSILMKSTSELYEIAENKDLPFWISIIVEKAKRDLENGSMEILEKLLDRVYGKPKEKIENTVKSENEIVILKIPDNGRNP